MHRLPHVVLAHVLTQLIDAYRIARAATVSREFREAAGDVHGKREVASEGDCAGTPAVGSKNESMNPLRMLEAWQVMGRFLYREPPRHTLEGGSIRLAFRLCMPQNDNDEAEFPTDGGYTVYHATALAYPGDTLRTVFTRLTAYAHAQRSHPSMAHEWADLPPMRDLSFIDDSWELDQHDDSFTHSPDLAVDVCDVSASDDVDPARLSHIRVSIGKHGSREAVKQAFSLQGSIVSETRRQWVEHLYSNHPTSPE